MNLKQINELLAPTCQFLKVFKIIEYALNYLILKRTNNLFWAEKY